jgi:hypothetical protein
MEPLELAAARYRLGLEDGTSLRALGESLLSKDHDMDAAVRLTIVDDLAMSEVGPIFERVCREVEQTIPSLDEAIRIVSTKILCDIAEGSIDPQMGLQSLMDDIYWPHLAAITNTEGDHYVGESQNLQSLIGAYWGYDELRKRPTELTVDGEYGEDAIALLDQRVKVIARDWLN